MTPARTSGRAWRRLGAGVGALLAASALATACGQVLGLDGIQYDVGDGASAATPGLDATTEDATEDGSRLPTPDAPLPPGEDGATPPTGPVTIATSASGAVQGVAVDDARIYWVTAGASGSVLSVLKDGGGLTTIATSQPSPLDVAVQGTNLYWSVTPAGTGPQCMAMVASTTGVAPDGGSGAPSCVLSSPDVTVRMTLGGASIVLLAQGTGAAANNEYIGTPSAGQSFMNVETQGPSSALTATETQAFLGNASGPHVDEVALSGLTFGPIVCTTSCGGTSDTVPADMVTDVSVQNLLWLTKGGSVVTAPITVNGSVGTQYVQVPNVTARRMARDASYVYFTTTAQYVFAVPIAPGMDAGAYLTLSNAENQPFGIAVDQTSVYWGDATGRIRKTNVP